MNIRKAELKDVDSLVELFDAYRRFYQKPSDVVLARKFLEERITQNDSEIFIIENEIQLVGFVQLYPLFSSTRMKKYWLLNDLFIHKYYRGKGYSKALIDRSKQLCRDTKACGILLETGKDNLVGNQLYLVCSFETYDKVNFYEWSNPEQ